MLRGTGFHHRGVLPHLLRPEAYFSPSYFAAEREKVFSGSWQFFCVASAVGEDGAIVSRDVLGEPVVVRRVKGRLVAHKNVCPHRHSLIVAPGRSSGGVLRCLYHGWEFDGEGRLCRLPDGGSFSGFKAREVCLESYDVDACGGLVFVRVGDAGRRGSAPWLGDVVGDLALDLERFFGNHRLVHVWTTEHAVNWKVIAENAVESYHVPVMHPRTFRRFREPGLHEHTLAPFFTRYRDLLAWGWSFQGVVARVLTALIVKSPNFHRFTQAHLFPNLLLYYGELGSSLIHLEPLAPERTRHTVYFFEPCDTPFPGVSRLLQWLFRPVVMVQGRRILAEDMRCWPYFQAGLRASAHRGVLGAREERVYWFQRFIAERVAGELVSRIVSERSGGGGA